MCNKERKLPTNYVLIDYENVQPSNLALLDDQKFKVIVFCGTSQNRISFDLADSMQKLGNRGQYVRASASGKNSIDFHIAFHVGRLSRDDPGAHLHIVSKDKGFEPLIAHLKSYGVTLHRVDDIADIKALCRKRRPVDDAMLDIVVKNLIGRGLSRPRKISGLKNSVNTLFPEKLKDDRLSDIVTALQQRKYLVLNGENVVYQLPTEL